ncbi:elongation factor Tu domain 2 protein [Methanococcus vannielii SB]|jgi:selenocysteine-specific translation elongation factor|uniref:Elongation factor Tu domain 2 protein n=1 Tax=Methanococcus vannielii (strain ATCC 35089 / DSM 1224 / JCM 13029 / OCM 148 / SB) TaxID=406327 RepID=A6USM8_METVS|nr:EF-Tu/IF-2/RF-3 family GTPase [Methanococcus vannielii]ABR55500.1 elongation factor Tu domain 2 protein [Methanococcus vannielii SB]
MTDVAIGIFGDFEDAGKNIAKKGTSTDITLYNYKNGDDSAVFIEPTRYPERIHPLIYAINMMDYALVFIDEIKPEIGETLLTLNLFGVERGFFVVGEYVDINQLKSIISNTSMKNFEILEKDYIKIREKMVKLPEVEKSSEYVKIPIDHFFSVRSVGTVILGKVEKGNVSVHDNLRIYPKTAKAMVKSIQVHDRDVKEAKTNSRVGLALKGIDVDDLERGLVLSNGNLSVSDKVELEMTWNPYMTKEIISGEGYQIVVGLQTVSCKVDSKNGNRLKLSLLKPVCYESGDIFVLLDGSAKVRVLGVSKI